MMNNSIKATHTRLTKTNLALAGLAMIPVAATAALPFVEDFETIPESSENVPNVALFAPAPTLQWYNRYDNAGSQVGPEEGDLSVAFVPVDLANNRWPEASSPERSSVLSVGWAYESVRTIIALDFEDTWDKSKDYQLTFQWALADHSDKTGRIFKAEIYGCPSYLQFQGTPVEEELLRSYPLDGLSSPAGALIKEVNLDPEGNTPFGEVQNQTIIISGAEIEAASQNGSQIYFGFQKGVNTEFFMVDNVSFQEFVVNPEPETPQLGIAKSEDGLLLNWASHPGMLYRIRTTDDLSNEVSSWSILEEDITSTPPLNQEDLLIETSNQFFVLEEYPDPNFP